MNELSRSQHKYLIEALSRGDITEDQALQFAARNKVIASSDYNKTLVGTGLFAALAFVVVGATGGMLAGAVVLAMGLEGYFKQRKGVKQKLRRIDAGDYREEFEDDPETLKLINELKPSLAKQDTAVVDVKAVEVPSDAPATATTPQQQGNAPATASELLERLKVECPELLKLVKAPPIRLVGLQRTGKSTFARKLALLRTILLPGHTVAWATPHREVDNLVPEPLNPFGHSDRGKNMPEIESAWSGVQTAIDKGQQLNLTAVWDEFGSYDQFEDKEALGASLMSLLREATKHGYFPVLIAHGDQANFYPGVKNILTTLHKSTVKVETIGEAIDAFGTMAPTGKVRVTWLDNSTVEISLPNWLTVDLLLSMQPESTRPALLDEALGTRHSAGYNSQKQDDATSYLSDRTSINAPDEGSDFDTLFQNIEVSEDVLKEQKAIGSLVEKIQELDGQWLAAGTYRQSTRYYKNQDIAVLENAFLELATKYPEEFQYDESMNAVNKQKTVRIRAITNTNSNSRVDG